VNGERRRWWSAAGGNPGVVGGGGGRRAWWRNWLGVFFSFFVFFGQLMNVEGGKENGKGKTRGSGKDHRL